MNAIKTLKTALAHATFEDADIKAATDKLVDKLGDELYAAGYDEGTEVEEAIQGVEAVITTVEEEKETGPRNGKTGSADDDLDEDPFAGLEDPDEK